MNAPNQLKDFQVGSNNWRETLRQNERRTRFVIGLFVALYGCVGLLVDVVLLGQRFPHVPVEKLLLALVTLKVTPIATLILLAVAAISLFVTYSFHNRLMLMGTEYHEITPETAQSLEEKQLYNVVEEMKISAGLNFMPKVYIIEAPYMNAFASGYSEKSAMVAITRGLLEKLDRAETQAVMAHELSHIRHHDIKLTLTVTVLSNLMLMVIDMLFYSMFYGRRSDDRKGDSKLFLVIFILRMVLPILTVILMMYLSRTREYMADAGAVELMRDNEPMANALLKIHQDHQANADSYRKSYHQTAHEQVRRAAYLYDPKAAGIALTRSMTSTFSTHPGLEDRLAALGFHRLPN